MSGLRQYGRISASLWRVAGLLFLALLSLPSAAQVDVFYGEPVEMKSNFIYFTSWKYVRQGSFGWQIEHAPDATEEEKNVGAWLEGDGTRPARFEVNDMPRGIRLVAGSGRSGGRDRRARHADRRLRRVQRQFVGIRR